MELNAGHPAAHHWYAINYLVPLQRFDEASAELRRAIDADPLSMPIRATLGLRSYYAHEFERARRELRDTLELDPASAMGHLFLGLTLAETGSYDDGLAKLHKGSELAASPEMTAALGYALGRAGHAERAREAIRELTVLAASRYVSPSLLAQIHAGLGDAQAALDALERAVSARAADLAWLSVRPVFDRLHSEPRFNALVARLGV
jgi:serine/threonine-protein kinase